MLVFGVMVVVAVEFCFSVFLDVKNKPAMLSLPSHNFIASFSSEICVKCLQFASHLLMEFTGILYFCESTVWCTQSSFTMSAWLRLCISTKEQSFVSD